MPEMRVDDKTLETIFDTEGWIEGFGKIGENVRVVNMNSVDVYPQDIVDAVRYIVDKKLVKNGVGMLKPHEDAMMATFELGLKSNHSNQGRFVPPLELEVRKSKNTYDGTKFIGETYYCRIIYMKYDGAGFHDFIFAEFNVPQKSLLRIKD